MHTIRGSFLIVSSFIISICLLTQERTDINKPLFIIDEITFDSYTLNSFSQSNSRTGLASGVNSKVNDNTNFQVKTNQPILVITELNVDDLLHKPYVLSDL